MKIYKWLNRSITTKLLAVIFLFILIISLIPLLMVSSYNVPSADDYSHSFLGYTSWSENRSIPLLIKAAFEHIIYTREYTSGLYSISIITVVAPFVMHNYWIIAYITIIPLSFFSIFFLFMLFRNIFKADAWSSLLIAVITSICMIQGVPGAMTIGVPSPVESFYWHPGATTYTTATALFFLTIGLSIKLNYTESKRYKIYYSISCPIMVIFYSGANYITSFGSASLSILIICLFILARVKPKIPIKLSPYILIPVFFSVCSFLFATTAPGNARRFISEATREIGNPTIFSATHASLSFTGDVLLNRWMTPFLLICIIFLIPFFVKIAKNLDFSFKFPVLVTLVSYLYLSSLAFPNYFAIIGYIARRIQGVIYSVFIILLILNVFYWVGWVSKKLLNRHLISKLMAGRETQPIIDGLLNFCRKHAFVGVVLLAVFSAPLFISVMSVDYSARDYSTPAAIWDLRTGRASTYYSEYLKRLKVLEDPEIMDVVFDRFSVYPNTLFYTDIVGDEHHPLFWQNMVLRRFYNKDSIFLSEVNYR